MKTADIAVFTEDKTIWLGTLYNRANVRACMDSSMLPCKGKGLKIEPSVTVGSNSQLTQHRADGKQLIIRYQGNDAGDVVVATDKKQQYLFDFYVRNDLVVHGAKIFFRFTAKRNGVEEFYGESDAIGVSDYACSVEMTTRASTPFLDAPDDTGTITWYNGDGRTSHWLEAIVRVRNKVGNTVSLPEGAVLDHKLIYDGGEDAPKNVIHPPKPRRKKKKEDSSEEGTNATEDTTAVVSKQLLNTIQVGFSGDGITVKFRIEEVSGNHGGRPFRLEATVAAPPSLGPVAPGRSDPVLVKSKPPKKKKGGEDRNDSESAFHAELMRDSPPSGAAVAHCSLPPPTVPPDTVNEDVAQGGDNSTIVGDPNGNGDHPPPANPPSGAAIALCSLPPPPVPPGTANPGDAVGNDGDTNPSSGAAVVHGPLSLIAGHTTTTIDLHLSAFTKSTSLSASSCCICGLQTLLLSQAPCLCDAKRCTRSTRSICVGEQYYDVDDGEICICTECYKTTGRRATIQIINGTHLKKDRLQPADLLERKEAMLNCSHCQRPFHAVCGLSLVPHEANQQAMCPSCLKEDPCPNILLPLSAESFPETDSSRRLELHIRTKLRSKLGPGSDILDSIFVRQVSSTSEEVQVDQRLLEALHYPSSMPYVSNCFAVFQRRDGIDVLSFIVYVHEYGSNCPLPNKDTAYFSYLEKVDYIFPKETRTFVFQELLIEYTHILQDKGFRQVMIWSSPPMTGDEDYIFNVKPKDQTLISQERLNSWYQDIAEECKQRGICTRYGKSFECFIENPSSDILPPYMKGDIISMKIIKALDRRGRKTANSIFSFLQKQLEGEKENLFLLTLAKDAKGTNENAEAENQVEIDGGVFRDRSELLHNCKVFGYQFDTLRRAKHATMALIRQAINSRTGEPKGFDTAVV